jgi:hypothetical protein
MTRALLLSLSLSLLAPTLAHADLAPPLPEDLDCPRGAVGTSPPVPEGATDERGRPLRPYPYCGATTCTTDADCTGGRVCSTDEIGLCMETIEAAGGASVRQARERGCEPDGTCLNVHSTCERARRCVAAGDAPPTSVAPPPPTSEAPATTTPPPTTTTEPAPAPEPSSGMCAASPGTAPLGALGLAVAAAALAFARRRG